MNRGCQSPKVKRYNRVADAIEGDQLSNKFSKGSTYDDTSMDRGRKGVRSQSPMPRENSYLLRSKYLVRKKPECSPDYLTPMRQDRVHFESLRGQHKIDFNEIKGRARAKASQEKVTMNFLGHLANRG